MKTTSLERLFIIGASLVLNKLFLFWLIGASNMFVMFAMLSLLLFNLMILAKSIDKLVATYEKAKKKEIRSDIKM